MRSTPRSRARSRPRWSKRSETEKPTSKSAGSEAASSPPRGVLAAAVLALALDVGASAAPKEKPQPTRPQRTKQQLPNIVSGTVLDINGGPVPLHHAIDIRHEPRVRSVPGGHG